MGNPTSIEDLAGMMLALQKRGCHNINMVTPTHYSPHILLALHRASQDGLRLPLVYNTCGWESLDVLKHLDGVVDIYLPDFKYGDADASDRYSSGARAYVSVTQAAFLEMQRQVGTARPAADGLINRGLMIRHLVMPNRAAHSKNVIRWIAENLPKDSYINLMSQYVPVFKAHQYPEIARRIKYREYREVVEWAREAGLSNVHTQGMPLLS
jgi:putative pyruvate formate lyase activating enzyme